MAAALSSIVGVSGASLQVGGAAAAPGVRGESNGSCLSAAGSLARRTLGQPARRVAGGTCSDGLVIEARAQEFSRRVVRVQVNRGEEYATVRSVPVQVARELLNAGHRYLDVRTVEEYAAGHIEGAVNVPYMHKAGSGMSKNLRFVDDVRKHFHKDNEIVVGCQSGRRSLMAAHEMEAAEFTGVTDMVGGYRAWVESGLPTKVLQA